LAPGATSFPQAIALAGTWDLDLVEKVFAVAATEIPRFQGKGPAIDRQHAIATAKHPAFHGASPLQNATAKAAPHPNAVF